MNLSSSELRVLIVDDVPEIRRVLRLFLQKTLHAEVVEAENGLSAIERFLEGEPDLMFCDLNMPEITGMEFLGFVRSQTPPAHTRIVVLSSDDEEDSKVQAGRFSVSAFLQKPFNSTSIRSTLEQLLPSTCFREEIACAA